jgi:hypothetical protein
MEMQKSKRRELTLQEKRAARMWAEGIDIDGEPAVSKADIARRCGMTQQQLYLLFKRADFLDEVDRCLGEIKIASNRTLIKSLPKAVDKLVDIMQNGKDREALSAASKIIGLAGGVELGANDLTGVVRGGFGRSDEVLPDPNVIDITEGDGV